MVPMTERKESKYMRSYEERAKDFIKEIFPYIHDYMGSPWCMHEVVDQFNKEHSRHVQMRSGCARIALLTSDYVVKFDYDEDTVDEIGGCLNEMYMYDIAEREGYAYLFAKITHVTYQDRDFFIMPRIRTDEVYGSAWHHLTDAEASWCHKHSITDLHSGNYGFRNGHVCIFDYGYINNMVDSPRSYGSYKGSDFTPVSTSDGWEKRVSFS